MTDFATNPRATFDYEIMETLEAGLLLKGFEVKSIKTGKVSLRGSYVKIINGKPMLVGATISPYQEGNMHEDYDPQASRTLLLSKREIDTLMTSAKNQGLTAIPLKLYSKGNLIKLQIGIARGKKKYDKRESIKKKDIARAQQRGTDL
jgi:SsrA-binding protein